MSIIRTILLILLPLRLLSFDANQTIAPVISYLLSNNVAHTQSVSSITISYLLSDNKNLGRIMPLGDSITWDWYYGDTRPDSLRHAYRNHLWWKLKASGYQMDFVGSRRNGSAVKPAFDGDNESYTGETCTFISDHIYGWLQKNPADTILLHIGTNDSVSNSPSVAVAHAENILKEIDRYENNYHVKIKVILAKIIKLYRNGDSGYYWVIDFNKKLAAMAQRRIDNGDNLQLVDMESGAGLNYPNDLIDGIHPTNCGYEKMANAWYSAITGYKAPPLKFCN